MFDFLFGTPSPTNWIIFDLLLTSGILNPYDINFSNLEAKIAKCKKQYIIQKTQGTNVYVFGDAWYWVNEAEKKQFMIDYAIAQDFQKAYKGYCNIYDFGSDLRLISYNLNTNTFYYFWQDVISKFTIWGPTGPFLLPSNNSSFFWHKNNVKPT